MDDAELDKLVGRGSRQVLPSRTGPETLEERATPLSLVVGSGVQV